MDTLSPDYKTKDSFVFVPLAQNFYEILHHTYLIIFI